MSRVVVVTGASYGAGRAIAAAFAERGDRVGLLARTEDYGPLTAAATVVAHLAYGAIVGGFTEGV